MHDILYSYANEKAYILENMKYFNIEYNVMYMYK